MYNFHDFGPVIVLMIAAVGGLLWLERRLTRLETWKDSQDQEPRRKKPKR